MGPAFDDGYVCASGGLACNAGRACWNLASSFRALVAGAGRAIATLLVDVLVVFVIGGRGVGAVEVMALVAAAGFTFSFDVRIAYAYHIATTMGYVEEAGPSAATTYRFLCSRRALQTIGVSMATSMACIFSCGLMLCFCTLQFFFWYGIVFLVASLLLPLHAMAVMCLFLMVFGPTPYDMTAREAWAFVNAFFRSRLSKPQEPKLSPVVDSSGLAEEEEQVAASQHEPGGAAGQPRPQARPAPQPIQVPHGAAQAPQGHGDVGVTDGLVFLNSGGKR